MNLFQCNRFEPGFHIVGKDLSDQRHKGKNGYHKPEYVGKGLFILNTVNDIPDHVNMLNENDQTVSGAGGELLDGEKRGFLQGDF